MFEYCQTGQKFCLVCFTEKENTIIIKRSEYTEESEDIKL